MCQITKNYKTTPTKRRKSAKLSTKGTQFPVSSGLVSRVGASHGVSFTTAFFLEQNCPRKITDYSYYELSFGLSVKLGALRLGIFFKRENKEGGYDRRLWENGRFRLQDNPGELAQIIVRKRKKKLFSHFDWLLSVICWRIDVNIFGFCSINIQNRCCLIKSCCNASVQKLQTSKCGKNSLTACVPLFLFLPKF